MFVDVHGGAIDTLSHAHQQMSTAGRLVGNVVPCALPRFPDATLLACVETSVVTVNFESNQFGTEILAKVPPTHLGVNRPFQFNDGKVDPRGRLWVGTLDSEIVKYPDLEEKGRLYCLQRKNSGSHSEDGVHELVGKLDEIRISNGLDWYGSHMYHIDSMEQGFLMERQSTHKGIVSCNGRRSGPVWSIDNDRTSLDRGACPCRYKSCIWWYGKDLSELYVTSSLAFESLPPGEVSAQAGGLFQVHILGVKGHAFVHKFLSRPPIL